MKKHLLLGAAVLASSMSFAQSRVAESVEATDRYVKEVPNDPVYYNPSPIRKSQQPLPMTKAAVNKTMIATSYNMYSVLTSIQTCITANEELDMIAFTHRQDTAFAGGSGVVQMSFSQDAGNTWTYIRTTEENIANRYPSGVVYNPAGNASLSNAWGITVGPRTAGGWNYNFYASAALDSSAVYQQYDTNTAEASSLVRRNLEVANNGVAHVAASIDDGVVYTGAMSVNGTYSAAAGGYVFTQQDIFAAVPGNNLEPRGGVGSAWSADGNTGYFVVITVDTVAGTYLWPSPRVFKTIDGGTSWVLLPEFDFSTIARINDLLPAYNGGGGASAPFFISDAGYDFTVDANGQLHVFCGVAPAFSNHPDSTNFLATSPHYIVDVWTTATGWDGVAIAPIMTDAVTAADDTDYGIGWDQRLQAGRSDDGSKVYAVWMDTDTTVLPGQTLNMFPDVFAWSLDVNAGLQTDAVNFTTGTAYDADNFWMFGSNIALNNENGGIEIPVSTSVPTPADPVGPMTHYLLSGVEFDQADYYKGLNVSIEEAENFTLGSVYPNPTNGIANLEINLDNKSDVTLQVINAMGQIVETIATNDLPAGMNKVTFNTNHLAKGMYFVNVTVGNSTSSSSFLVQ